MGSETLSSTHILSDEYRIPFYSYFPTNLVYPFTLKIDSASDPDHWGRKRFLLPVTYTRSETLPSACYILWGRKRFLLPLTYFRRKRFLLPVTYFRSKRFLLPVTYFPTHPVNPPTSNGYKN